MLIRYLRENLSLKDWTILSGIWTLAFGLAFPALMLYMAKINGQYSELQLAGGLFWVTTIIGIAAAVGAFVFVICFFMSIYYRLARNQEETS